ncbi:MAG: hypothetical protein ABR576_05165 [Thermoanaerobaculia bacterium]
MKQRSAALLAVLGIFAAALPAQTTPTESPAVGQTEAPAPTRTPAPPAAPGTPTPAATPPALVSPGTPPAPPAPAPTATPTRRLVIQETPARIVDPPAVPIGVLPPENPFASRLDSPPALPPKPPLQDAVLPAAMFVELRVDPAGKPLSVRRARDPIPSLAAETQKDLARWTFEPAQRGGQKVETWTPLRLDLQIEVEAPRVDQASLTPITPTTALPAPLDWGSDDSWYQGLKAAPAGDGTVPVGEGDVAAAPKRTPFPDSFKGPFSARFWVRVSPAGKVDRIIPIAASEPILIAYFRRGIPGWTLRPARLGNAPVESWNELTLSGQVSYSVDIRQIGQLRKPLASS